MKNLITLDGFSKNKDKFIRLIEFFKEILDICNVLDIAPIVDGGLAVFAYTKDHGLVVNDIDVGFPEAKYPKMIEALEERGINCKLREWHVLQVLKEDLKIELGSIEYWYKDLPLECKTLQIDGHKVKILGLNSLRELYKRGIDYFANKGDEPDRLRFEAYKIKYELLKKLSIS